MGLTRRVLLNGPLAQPTALTPALVASRSRHSRTRKLRCDLDRRPDAARHVIDCFPVRCDYDMGYKDIWFGQKTERERVASGGHRGGGSWERLLDQAATLERGCRSVQVIVCLPRHNHGLSWGHCGRARSGCPSIRPLVENGHWSDRGLQGLYRRDGHHERTCNTSRARLRPMVENAPLRRVPGLLGAATLPITGSYH